MDLQVPADPWEQLWQQAEQKVAANSEKHGNNKQTKKRRKADDENLKNTGLGNPDPNRNSNDNFRFTSRATPARPS